MAIGNKVSPSKNETLSFLVNLEQTLSTLVDSICLEVSIN